MKVPKLILIASIILLSASCLANAQETVEERQVFPSQWYKNLWATQI